MTTTTRSTAALALLVCIPLALTACGSSSPTASKPPSKAARLASARRSLLVVADLQTGWKASGSVTAGSGGGSDSIPTSKIASCLGVPASQVASNPPAENSPTFNDPSGTISVDDQVEAFATTAVARLDYSTFSNTKTPSCVVSVLGPVIQKEAQQGAGSGSTVGTITATRHPLAPFGDRSGEIVLQIPVSTSSGSTTVDLSLIVITVGPLETTLTISSVGAPASSSLATTVATAAVRHMS